MSKLIKAFRKSGGKVKSKRLSPYYNHEGYPDPTAYYGIKAAMKDDGESRQVHKIINIIKDIIDMTDFEIVGRIELRNKKSGRVFK